ncbi:hypothetical protein HDV01_003832 [Terramyces sp. JEL0728]|nr:hypothetical protein HDV01_003832 [Terramyces sp. JEL0728]
MTVTKLNYNSPTGYATTVFCGISILFSIFMLYKLFKGYTANKTLTLFLITTQVVNIITKILSYTYYFVTPYFIIFNITAILETLLLFFINITNLEILAIFSILNENITQKKLWVYRILFLAVTLVICTAIVMQMFYQALDVPPPLSKLIQYGILVLCAITAAYDNAQVIYLAHLIFITKRNRNRVEEKLKKVIIVSFTVVIIDWLGVCLYGYNIIMQPKQTLYLLTQCVIGIHTSMMAFVLSKLKELTFGGRTIKRQAETAATVKQVS